MNATKEVKENEEKHKTNSTNVNNALSSYLSVRRIRNGIKNSWYLTIQIPIVSDNPNDKTP